MIIPKPLPGESAHSHRERLASFNYHESFAKTIAALRFEQRIGSDYRKKNDVNQIVANLCDMTEAQYLARHSLDPVHRLMLFPRYKQHAETSLFTASYNSRYYGKSFSKDVFRCPDCDDLAATTIGITYLHRVHYLPDIDVCAMHGTPLVKINNHQPLSWRCKTYSEPSERPSGASIDDHRHPAISRYIEASHRILDCKLIPDRAEFSKNCIDLLRQRGLLTSGKDEWSAVPQYLSDALPTAWRAQHYPILDRDPQAAARYIRTHGHAAVLLLSAVTASVEQVLDLVIRSTVGGQN